MVTIRIAYRRDAPPFSYQNADATPEGFIVDLCQEVAKRLSQQLDVPPLKVSYVPVTASDRLAQFNKIRLTFYARLQLLHSADAK